VRLALVLACALAACATDPQLPHCPSLTCEEPVICPADCGPAPTIEDADYWANPTSNNTWCMSSEHYSATRSYVRDARRWMSCKSLELVAPADACFCVVPDGEDTWCTP
jgi:hypothetical protein